MMESKKLPDTPWHVGYTKKEENDPRRHKSRCIYKQNRICHQGKSGAYMLKCPGSSHCRFYSESEDMAEDVYLKTRSVEEEYADNMQGVFFAGKAKIDDNFVDEKTVLADVSRHHVVKFPGTEAIRMNQIKVSNKYKQWKPDQQDVDRLLAFYDEYHKLDKPIIVAIRDDEYCIKGNFLQYYVSKLLNKTWIKATMNIVPINRKKKRH